MKSWFAVFALVPALAGCGPSTAASCTNYVTSYNACAAQLGQGLTTLPAEAYCLAYTLPGIPSNPELAAAFDCLATAYDNADCSSQEALSESLNESTCDDVPEGSATEDSGN